VGEVGDWTIAIVSAVAVAAVVAIWRPAVALALSPVAAVGFVASLGYSINRWEECDPCPRVEHAFEWMNTILLALAPSLLVVGFGALVVKRFRGDRWHRNG
jgi:hypothetical protein